MSDFEVSALGVIAALVKRAENAERKEREWVDEWRKACKRAQEAERERDKTRRDEWNKAREHFDLQHKQVMAQLQACGEHGATLLNRIAQLEAALQQIRMILKSDSIEYDDMRNIDSIIDAALRPAGPPAKHPSDCLCDDCVKFVKGKLYYSDGKTLVPEADHGKGGGT